MAKSADAFRTISEVSEWLDTPAHVLRFWESKFSQVKPVKRAGGRRYYRPSDMELLGGIKRLLHEDGMTIKGVQKLLREKGVAHVAALSQPLDDVTAAVRDAMDGKAKKAAETVELPAETSESPVPGPVPVPVPDPVPTPDATPAVSMEAPVHSPAANDDTPAVTPVLGMPASIPPAAPPVTPATAPDTAAEIKPSTAPSPLAAIYARKAPLSADATAELAGLKKRLQVWLAAEIG